MLKCMRLLDFGTKFTWFTVSPKTRRTQKKQEPEIFKNFQIFKLQFLSKLFSLFKYSLGSLLPERSYGKSGTFKRFCRPYI